MRMKYQKDFMKKHRTKLGLMSPLVQADAYALQEIIDGYEIIYRHFVDTSIAVATSKGLVVPVLRNVELINYTQIENELAALEEKDRDNRLALGIDGGTFTISSGGVFGSVSGGHQPIPERYPRNAWNF
ncbi:unnamed protein product [Cylicocyclus nassatus]|uniref:Dihydrolipoyllysine-residue succinyltransferase component of 2-oxoglutarate dehydrogenase complex, mitochondrial n=1 Tax=Cylicocyclus nassatus TaxID=53992 RepID=A0AA36DPA6_CYLNA|nr:unnamed protein product [Cylicocyclus nassatus]